VLGSKGEGIVAVEVMLAVVLVVETAETPIQTA
jgi:hypothetical protein